MKASIALLLASGKGERAGGPKAWRPLGGNTYLERQAAFLAGRFGPEKVFVSVQEAWLERCRAIDARIRWIPADAELPPMGAILAILAKAPSEGWATLHHVDMPLWEEEVFAALESALPEAEAGGYEAVVPAHDGAKGHPVLLSPALRRELAGLDARRDRLDRVLHAKKVLVRELPFHEVLENRNAP